MASNAAPIIVIKRKKAGGGGHHGGAWKVAYADFVTAMMAFFLLLWLLNSTTQEQRSGISNYFSAASVTRTTSGAGKILGGATITLDGPAKGKGAPIGSAAPSSEKTSDSDADSEDRVDTGTKDERTKDQDNAGKNKEAPPDDANEAQMQEILRQREDRSFEQTEKALKRAVETTPGLRKLADNLLVERTPDGLRIQIVDQDRTSMFATGSAIPYQHTRQLLEVVAKVIATMPNKVSISGHTDGVPYTRGGTYSNWELSSDRALSSRRALTRYGLAPERIIKVVGRADTEHLIASDPKSSRNRRIAITLLRQTPPPPKVGNSPRADVSNAPKELPSALKPPAAPQIAPPPVATGAGGLRLAPGQR